MFKVYLPPMNGKLPGWLKGTIWTTNEPSARTFASREDAQAAIEKARKFHMARVMKAARIVEAEG